MNKFPNWWLNLLVAWIVKVSLQVEGVLKLAEIKSEMITQRGIELDVDRIFAVHPAQRITPFAVEDAARPEESSAGATEEEKALPRVLLDTRLNNRVIDLRTATNQAIFRINRNLNLFREFFLENSFIEIHSPKLISAASEVAAMSSKFPTSRLKPSWPNPTNSTNKWPFAVTWNVSLKLPPVFVPRILSPIVTWPNSSVSIWKWPSSNITTRLCSSSVACSCSSSRNFPSVSLLKLPSSVNNTRLKNSNYPPVVISLLSNTLKPSASSGKPESKLRLWRLVHWSGTHPQPSHQKPSTTPISTFLTSSPRYSSLLHHARLRYARLC